ncbi:MAG: zinc ribbon domain-containing protein [Anaerolineae bacterium]|nr:zinc ribbon domain-containing protein [Anaerolineae bacterium]
MPIYEYKCPDCGEEFEKLVRGMSDADQVSCPTCNSDNVKRKMSLVAAKGGEACGTCTTGCSSGTT